jgi:hypothetical protein
LEVTGKKYVRHSFTRYLTYVALSAPFTLAEITLVYEHLYLVYLLLMFGTDQAGFDEPPSDDEDEDDYDLQDVSSDVEIDPAELDIPSDEEDDSACVL